MAPARSRKQSTSVSSDEEIPSFPVPPANSMTETTRAHTPERTTGQRAVEGITQAQKQSLIDNLQLEITERARKLRAQSALQAQGLRARLEMRVNRIPQSMRKRNLQELIDEHAAKAKPAPPPPVPVVANPAQAPQPKKPAKRKSDEMSHGDDKENMPSADGQELANPKKRTKTTAVVANSKATRTASRKAGPAGVLSPKSHNSRTYPQSPFKPSTLSSEKAQPARPLVPTSAATAKGRTTRAPSRQTTKRTGQALDSDGRTSEASNTSAGTTVITRPGTVTRKAAAAPKKAPAGKTNATGRKQAAAKQEVAAPPARRTLRNRN